MVKVHTDQSFVNEDVALSDLILSEDKLKNNIVVFDRGLQSRQSFEQFSADQKFFITRAKLNTRCNLKEERTIPAKAMGSTLTVISDITGHLIDRRGKNTQRYYRVIRGAIDATGDAICFVTNILDEDPYQIASWYKQRWEIEVFFKFIKQHLNAKHLVSRSANGIKVMLYMTIILAILVIVYKKLNNIKSYKIAKLKFELELENEAIRNIVVLCGGNPEMAKHLFNSA